MAPEIRLGVSPEDVDIDFPVAPVGTYPCQITSVPMKDSKAGNAMIVVGLTPNIPIDCQVGGKVKTITGKELFKLYVSLKADALYTLKALANACGGNGVGWRGGSVFPEEFLGKTVRVVIENVTAKDGSGKINSQVKQVLPA